MQRSRDGLYCSILIASATVFVLSVTGCRSDNKPKTHPVKGKVVLKQGDVKGLAEGYVELRSISDPTIVATGEIKDDGSFVLGSLVRGKDCVGALEGGYQARIDPPKDGEGQPRPRSPALAPRFLSFDKSGLKYIVSPGRNDFTVEVEGLRRSSQ